MKNLCLLNSKFEILGFIDAFSSLIWTEKYAEAGDWELLMGLTQETHTMARQAKYAALSGQMPLMLVDKFETRTDPEDGDVLRITGRSAEMLLDRRIVWTPEKYDSDNIDIIKKLVDKHVCSPEDENRKISEIVQGTHVFTSTNTRVEYTGDSVYEAVKTLAKESQIGFRLRFDWSRKKLVFETYNGRWLSYSSYSHSEVVFSPLFDNLNSSEYKLDTSTYKNVALVLGEGENEKRFREIVEDNLESTSGINRRELLVDARDLRQKDGDRTYTDGEYIDMLRNRGQTKLHATRTLGEFDSKVDPYGVYTYGQDYLLGDVVEVQTKYGIRKHSRIAEITYSCTAETEALVPTFVNILQ